jgi:hypothetical protein
LEPVSFSCSFHYQYTYSIGAKYDWGYYLDYGLFSTYYRDEILPNRQYLEHRYNSNGFVFISDTFANKLLDLYGINDYKQLILDEKYCLLECEINNKPLKFCINNILYSNQRTGPRVQYLEDLFCVFHGRQSLLQELDFCVEVDLKSDIYGTGLFFKTLNALGYNVNNTEIQFKTYNTVTKEYEIREDLFSLFAKLDFNHYFSGEVIIYTLSFLPVLFLFFGKWDKIRFYVFYIIIFNIGIMFVGLFIFVPPLNMVYPTITFFAYLLFLLYHLLFVKLINYKIMVGKTKNNSNEVYYEIKI